MLKCKVSGFELCGVVSFARNTFQSVTGKGTLHNIGGFLLFFFFPSCFSSILLTGLVFFPDSGAISTHSLCGNLLKDICYSYTILECYTFYTMPSLNMRRR